METLDVALALGVLAIESGGSTPMADRVFRRVLAGSQVDDGFAVWRLDVAVAGRSTDGGAVVMQPIGRIGENFYRISEISLLADRVARHAIDPGSIAEDLDRIRQLESPYYSLVMLTATACSAGLFGHLQGADWRSAALAVLAASAGQGLQFPLHWWKASTHATTLGCAALSAIVAAVGLRLHVAHTPAVLVAAIVYLVPGLPLVNGCIDLASHRHLIIGAQRLGSAALQCALLAIAVALAITLVQ